MAVTTALVLATAALAAPPLQVGTSISPTHPEFADTIVARVDVAVDRNKVEPGSVRVDGSFGPWRQEGDARTATASSGSRAIYSWLYTLTCLNADCFPGNEPRAVQLPSVAVAARSRSGAPLTAKGKWPEFSVAARVPPASAAQAPFEIETALPPPNYRVSPTSLALALDAFAALLVVVAVVLLLPELARRRTRRTVGDDRSPLTRALAYVREAQRRRTEDRRRAVGLLARTLGRESNGLDAAASRVAWSATEPSPAKLEELARAVEDDRRKRT
jgi:hypothetical protein